jgi:hypothetical protein
MAAGVGWDSTVGAFQALREGEVTTSERMWTVRFPVERFYGKPFPDSKDQEGGSGCLGPMEWRKAISPVGRFVGLKKALPLGWGEGFPPFQA